MQVLLLQSCFIFDHDNICLLWTNNYNRTNHLPQVISENIRSIMPIEKNTHITVAIANTLTLHKTHDH